MCAINANFFSVPFFRKVRQDEDFRKKKQMNDSVKHTKETAMCQKIYFSIYCPMKMQFINGNSIMIPLKIFLQNKSIKKTYFNH